MVFLDGPDGVRGGFDCKHDGCRVEEPDGTARKRTAGEVLGWARRQGAVFSDHPGWNGGSSTGEQDAIYPGKERAAPRGGD